CTNAHRSPRLHPPFCCRRHHDRRLPHLSGLRASTHSCGGSGAPTRSRRLGGSTHPWQTRPRTLTFHDPTAALSGEDGRLKRLVTSAPGDVGRGPVPLLGRGDAPLGELLTD